MYPLTRTEFWKTRTSPFVRFSVLAGGIACFAVGLITLIAMGAIGLLDGLFMIGLGYGIAIRKSRACAVIASLYYALNQLLMRLLPINVQAATGAMVFTYILLGCMVLSIYGTFTFYNSYVDYIAEFAKEIPPPPGSWS